MTIVAILKPVFKRLSDIFLQQPAGKVGVVVSVIV
jgi:hypothetical protein